MWLIQNSYMCAIFFSSLKYCEISMADFVRKVKATLPNVGYSFSSMGARGYSVFFR